MAIRSEALLESVGLQELTHLSVDELPFATSDATAGSEDELQAVVAGRPGDCDLPLTIRESRFFRNIARRRASGEAPRRTLLDLETFLSDSREVWENSWIRFPQSRLSAHALRVFHADLRSVKNDLISERSDADRFRFTQNGELWLRIPISYAMKLSLADLAGTQPHMPEPMRAEVSRLMRHFLNDNTSPETTSFHIVTADSKYSLGSGPHAKQRDDSCSPRCSFPGRIVASGCWRMDSVRWSITPRFHRCIKKSCRRASQIRSTASCL